MSIRHGKRIAFMGAGGTGKTTTAEFLAEKTEIPLIKSAARTIYEERDLSEMKVSRFCSDAKLDLQTSIFKKKIENDKEFSFIADRTILDHYCYWLAYCGSNISRDNFLDFEDQTRIRMLSSYTHLFYFPWGFWEARSDGVRATNLAWQSQIDALITGYIMRWELPVTVVPQMQGEDVRNEFVLSRIKEE